MNNYTKEQIITMFTSFVQENRVDYAEQIYEIAENHFSEKAECSHDSMVQIENSNVFRCDLCGTLININMFDPINLSKEDLIKHTKIAIQSQKEYEKLCKGYEDDIKEWRQLHSKMEKALSICHDLLRDVDIYYDTHMEHSRIKECVEIASKGLDKLYKEFPDLFLLEAQAKTNTNGSDVQ